MQTPAPDPPSPSRLWVELPPQTRLLAARALYARDWGEERSRRDADTAIARALRFREAAIRKLPLEKRVDYLARMVRPDDPLASSLLLALHLEHRGPMLSRFLDALSIPHRAGLIAEDHDLGAPDPGALRSAVEDVSARFPPDEVRTYLRTLLAMDPQTWGALTGILAAGPAPEP